MALKIYLHPNDVKNLIVALLEYMEIEKNPQTLARLENLKKRLQMQLSH